MNLIAVSGSGYQKHQHACERLLSRLAHCDHDETVLLDFDTIEREAAVPGESLPAKVALLNFRTWVKPGINEDGVVDPHAIRRTAADVSCAQCIVIDARGYRVDLLVAALDSARTAWYPLESWHPLFAIICDDIHQLYVLDKLASTFYCQPQLLTDTEVASIVRRMQRISTVYRWLGVNAGRIHRMVLRIVVRRAKRRDSRFVTKSKKV